MRRSSEETKAVILGAARERFAADGYERATIRAIAGDARIDPAMVMRYFGSKERLFAAACAFDLALPAPGAMPRERVGELLVAHFLERWESDEALQILLRTGVTNPSAAERMREIFVAQLVPLAAELSGDPESAPRRAGLVTTQVLGLALCRFVLEIPPVVAMGREEVVRWVGPSVQRYLLDPA
ncbi:TetR family transcriptional regulator [Nonomuraea sp. NPDC050383]|uniref:TetR/AcrR family transcriptional regulator n=1 Tax=Nonomuraea sp. NPDC050383 TaxID=3364362 RepID=UPI0037B759B4